MTDRRVTCDEFFHATGTVDRLARPETLTESEQLRPRPSWPTAPNPMP
ncbi:hypothetical protein [Streptomyces wuyuanensis]